MHDPSSDQSAPNPLLNVASGGLGHAVFFESMARLVDSDHNDVYDVYQWKDGALSLISSGASDSDGATYKGNSADGLNVYFATRDRVTWQDVDSVLDIYTARTDGGVPLGAAPPICAALADTCQGGGRSFVESPPVSDQPGGDGGPGQRLRRKVAVAPLSPHSRRRAAMNGVLVLKVTTSGSGTVRARVRAAFRGKRRLVGAQKKVLTGAGPAILRVRLDRRARGVLALGKRLKVSVTVSMPGARARTVQAGLRRGGHR